MKLRGRKSNRNSPQDRSCNASRSGGRAGSALRIHELMQTSPFITAPKAMERTGLTMPTVNSAIGELQRLGIVQEVTGRKRGRIYSYRAFMDILSEGVGPAS